jgi:hypothetical protein
MRRCLPVFGLLLVGTLLSCPRPALAQRREYPTRYVPARPTIGPYFGYFTYGGTTPLGPYLTVVRPEMWLSDTLARQRAALRGMSMIVERPRGAGPRAAARGGVPSTATGTGGVFMDYSHFYPTPEPYGRR